jgi:hypothetical protein
MCSCRIQQPYIKPSPDLRVQLTLDPDSLPVCRARIRRVLFRDQGLLVHRQTTFAILLV